MVCGSFICIYRDFCVSFDFQGCDDRCSNFSCQCCVDSYCNSFLPKFEDFENFEDVDTVY